MSTVYPLKKCPQITAIQFYRRNGVSYDPSWKSMCLPMRCRISRAGAMTTVSQNVAGTIVRIRTISQFELDCDSKSSFL